MAHRVDDPRARVEQRWRTGRPVGGVLGCALMPAAGLFRLAAGAYHAAYDSGVLRTWRAPVPVISVGNLTVGGTGKTPFTRWLVRRLIDRGACPGVLHGGYADDEPLLHRAWYPDIPVLAGRDRRATATAAVEAGATVLVMDDGFQHRRVARDLDIVLIAAETWTGTAPMLPRGPWREPLRALRRADLVVVTRRSADPDVARQVERALADIVPHCARARVHLAPAGWATAAGDTRTGGPGECVAVAGVGQPAAFREQALALGAPITELLEFPDHHRYSAEDAAAVLRAADGRAIVTTGKDAVKLRKLIDPAVVWVLDQQVVVEEGEAALKETLTRVVP
ncbi:MAG TPA: tetraacyldisaccharide 4'-kinase [Longimicrobiales bacterium]|nr:tetraacyldisaccharide 4'-kinase [Longimicrobiales bacterium]